jgi:SAM-dependent methyltransferase
MHEILRGLGAGARVLDLGCYEGSFPVECCPGAQVVRLDRSPRRAGDSLIQGGSFVQADATHLPFRAGAFDAVVANHCLEHMDDPDGVIREIGRVTRRGGSLYVAVPDGSSWTDRVYRWVYHGGEHVNLFKSADELGSRIAGATGLGLVAVRTLHSSYWFLNGARFHPRPPRKLWILGNGNLRAIAWLTYALRGADRLLATRTSVYGWALYFGQVGAAVETDPWTNVCVGCGMGRSAASLIANGKLNRAGFLPRSYHCPSCGVWNLFTQDPPTQDPGHNGSR